MERLLGWSQLQPLIPFTRQHIGRLEAKGLFPKRRRLSANRVAWLESEVQAWLDSRQLGGPPQKADLGPKPRPAPAPDPADLELLHQLLAKFGLEAAPLRSGRRRRRDPECREVGAGP
jgi:prophage regulatory protein